MALGFERPKEFIGLELEIVGSELTNPQAAEVFTRVLGKPVEFQELPDPDGKEWYQMFRWFNDAGFQEISPGCGSIIPRSTFRRWRNGCTTRAGTNASAVLRLPRSDSPFRRSANCDFVVDYLNGSYR